MESQGPKKVIHLSEKIWIKGPGGEERVRAKVDTGADRTTVDRDLAERLKLGPALSKVTLKASAGGQRLERPVVDAEITIAEHTYKLRVGVADRSQMRYRVIIGRDILRSGDFLIDPMRRKKKT